jgi:hypothetical protein
MSPPGSKAIPRQCIGRAAVAILGLCRRRIIIMGTMKMRMGACDYVALCIFFFGVTL